MEGIDYENLNTVQYQDDSIIQIFGYSLLQRRKYGLRGPEMEWWKDLLQREESFINFGECVSIPWLLQQIITSLLA